MMKCRACAWRMCLTCHNLETRGELAPSLPELIHNADDDHDPQMQGYNGDTATHSALPTSGALWPTLEHLKKLAENNTD